MGQIRTYQTDYLRQGAEQISFKRFTYDGTYQETIDANVLINCPEDVVPLNRSLQKLYEKPLKEVQFKTDFVNLYFKHRNSQFLYDSSNWIFSSAGSTFGAGEVVEDTTELVKALSGNKFVKARGRGIFSDTLIKNDKSVLSVKQYVPIVVQFAHHFYTLASSDTIRYYINVGIDASENGTLDHFYNFTNNSWDTIAEASIDTNHYYAIETTNINKWNGVKKTLEPFLYASDDNNKPIEVRISYPVAPNSDIISSYTYIDNFVIAEEVDVNLEHISSNRKQYSYAGTFTGKYETNDNIFSNEQKASDNFVGKITGEFERPRDSTTKTLEQIITQEIINDSREYLTKYEGVFRNKSDYNLGLHNKIWIDFGVDILQEPVSCYLDAMKFDVKKAQYDIRMHVPNQDDDVATTYTVIAE